MLDSQIFKFEFEFETWPGIHTCDEVLLLPYNENIFEIRNHYKTIFKHKKFNEPDFEGKDMGKKVHKVSYHVNLLPMLGRYKYKTMDPYTKKVIYKAVNNDVNLLEEFCGNDELSHFDCEVLKEMIEFKWNSFGITVQRLILYLHFLYLTCLLIYYVEVYLTGEKTFSLEGWAVKKELELSERIVWANYILVGFSAIPAIYELTQAVTGGFADYITQFQNMLDILYIVSTLGMGYLHYEQGEGKFGPYHWLSKMSTLLVVVLAIRRLFSYLRIYKTFAPIVTMLNNVVWDLRIFVTFYIIMTILFSLMFSVLGLGNPRVPGNYRQSYVDPNGNLDGEHPYEVYKFVGTLVANIVETFKLSLGDYSIIGLCGYLEKEDNILFWFLWFLVLISTLIIFLNFLIAEASNSYNVVSA